MIQKTDVKSLETSELYPFGWDADKTSLNMAQTGFVIEKLGLAMRRLFSTELGYRGFNNNLNLMSLIEYCE